MTISFLLDFRGLNSLLVSVSFANFMVLRDLAAGRVGVLVADGICCACCVWAVFIVLKCSGVLWKATQASKVVKFWMSEFWKISMLPISVSTFSQRRTDEIPYGQEARIKPPFFSKWHVLAIVRLKCLAQGKRGYDHNGYLTRPVYWDLQWRESRATFHFWILFVISDQYYTTS